VDALGDALAWLADPASWEGPRGIWTRLVEHVHMSGVAVLTACALALPPAIWLGHRRRFGSLAINVSNVGRAVPSFAILVIGAQLYGLRELPLVGSLTTFIALVVLAVPPLVTNTYVAVAEVPDDLRDAADGMGMASLQRLRRVELPVAAPLVVAGVRTAAVQVVATATIAAFVGAGGLGRFIIDGNAVRDQGRVLGGALLVAVLCLLTEAILALVQRLVTPTGIRGEAAMARASGEEVVAAAATEMTIDQRGNP
jgi:osmoprotectant transport system permease protein